MTQPFRNTLGGLSPFDHGLTVETVRRLSGRDDVLNLAGNENAVGASPRVAEAVRAAAEEAWRYPDPACTALGTALGEQLGIAPDRISFGTGSEALLAIIARAALDPGDRVVLSSPTFPIYAALAVAAGAVVVDVPRGADHNLDLDAMAEALSQPAKTVFLCNPNNPTGTPIPSADITAIARMAGSGCLVVLDEAYHEFHALEDPHGSLCALDASDAPWFVLRTFSKAYALGGYRVGYSVARSAALTGMLDRIRPQFGVGVLSERAALAALSDRTHLERSVAEIRAAREALRADLTALGLAVAPSATNFLYIAAPEGTADHLVRHGILVRPMPAGRMRLTVCRLRDVARVVEGFRSALDQ